MPEMKNNFQRGKMNKDLDERMVPIGEYRDALNIEVSSSEDSEIGALQTLKGNTLLSNLDPSGSENFTCIGSIVDGKNDVIYWMVAGNSKDMIVEFDYKNDVDPVSPVVIDEHAFYGERALNFNRDFLITGINVIEDFLFWTDNNSEPKKINIPLAKSGTQSGFNVHTIFMVRDVSLNAAQNSYIPAIDVNGTPIPIQEKHLTVIKKGPPAPPVLEMIDTKLLDWDGDGVVGGGEISATVGNASSINWINADGEIDFGTIINITTPSETDFVGNSDSWGTMYLNVYVRGDRSINARVEIVGIGGPIGYDCKILSGNPAISGQEDLVVELEEEPNLFEFKFPRFAYRYKYNDGEYSPFSPFTQPAFLPGRFDYMPKQGYNLGMTNRLRRLAIKDFVHERAMPEDVVSIDILYKESNSPNVYSVKTIKKRDYNPDKWDEWNATSRNNTTSGPNQVSNGWNDRTKGYLPITSEMIHAALPSNQLLRPWDNVPRKALAQEVIGSRLIYGNYLQNYNLESKQTQNYNIKVDIDARLRTREIGEEWPKEIEAGPNKLPRRYSPSKSIKSLRTYQLGVVYIDKYGRETPVFSEDKIGKVTGGGNRRTASFYTKKEYANKRTTMLVNLKNDPPDWATHFKFFVKETSNEYYNLAMDRWYDAEDGNVWLSFPSAERNKVDEETFLILKKTHDENTFVSDPARYKIIAIENEAPRFIKLTHISMGGLTDTSDQSLTPAPPLTGLLGIGSDGFPLEGTFFIKVEKDAFENAGWKDSLVHQDISQVYFRVKSNAGISNRYRLKQISFDPSGYYKLESDKIFGPDMSHTSPDGTWLNRITNCELQIFKLIPEDRAEFEGRFFVKILKDGTLIQNLGVDTGDIDDYIATNSMQVQYIDPKAAWSATHGNFYGSNRFRLSVDSKNDNEDWAWARPDNNTGHGERFWSYAGDDSDNTDSSSSGWFIDKVEAFRPFKYTRAFFNKNDDIVQRAEYLHHFKPGFPIPFVSPFLYEQACIAPYSILGYDMSDHADLRMLQACGLGTYDSSYSSGTNNYLGDSSMKGPGNKVGTSSSSWGGEVGPSMGINKEDSIIHLSYAGLNENSNSRNGTYSGGNWAAEWADWVFKAGQKHVVDIAFIEKLTTPEQLWRWKEDPGMEGKPIMYKTKLATSNPNITLSSLYNTTHLNRELNDLDSKPGVYLFNYAIFRDYVIDNHTCTNICLFHTTHVNHMDWVSRNISDHGATSLGFGSCAQCVTPIPGLCLDMWPDHGADVAHNRGPINNHHSLHKRFPTAIYDYGKSFNRRRRYIIVAETVGVGNQPAGQAPGTVGPHFYLPTNNPDWDPHFDHTATAIEVYPNGHWNEGNAFPDPAPGIRTDGMYSGYTDPNPYDFDFGDGNGVTQGVNIIPQYKRWDANFVTQGGNASPGVSNVPGSVTWELLEFFTGIEEKFTSTNPAIFETEPKEDVGLDIYHEAGHIYPIHLNSETIEQFVGAIHKDTSKNSHVQCWDPPYAPGNNLGTINISTGTGSIYENDIRVYAADGRFVQLADRDGVILDSNIGAHTLPTEGSYLMFWRADGGTTEAHVGSATYNNNGTWFELIGNQFNNDVGVHSMMIELPWFNCYTFGNGVESDRIRDDFNQVTIDNGPKASTTIEEPYLEDRRKHGFIWSGIYNSRSGVNNLNQFIQAEAITKDVNPIYGSVQKMHARDNDLVAFCEDRVLKVYANKDALFNADGNTNIVATNKVLGAVKPFVGDYGISKNPESFASDSYRSYFSDTSRGAIVRLSQDGLTAISNAGMKNWFSDNLPNYDKIIGSFDTNKDEYNVSLISTSRGSTPRGPAPRSLTAARVSGPQQASGPQQESIDIDTTLSFSEPVNGWVSFKSWVQESGVSLNNNYYTFKIGELYHHHTNDTRNNFYWPGPPAILEEYQYESSVDVLFNQAPGIIKSYSTLNYEGTQSRITRDINNNPDYYDNFAKSGWYIQELTSDVQELGELEFWDKEGKWFSQIKGVKTQWLNDGTAGNIDPREFSYQGIGNADNVACPDCPPVVSWICQENTNGAHFSPDCNTGVVAKHANGQPYIHYNLAAATAAGDPTLQNPDFINYCWLETAAQGVPGGITPAPTSAYFVGSTVYTDDATYINMDNPLPPSPGYSTCFINGIDNQDGHCTKWGGMGIDCMDPDGPSGPIAAIYAMNFYYLYNQMINCYPNTTNLTTSAGQSIHDAFISGNLVWYMEYDANGNSIFPPNVEALKDILNNAGVGTYDGTNPCRHTVPTTGGNSFSCVAINGTSGYATQQECLDTGCGQPTESWNCGPTGCTDPGDGTGQYTTFCECVNDLCCPAGEDYFFTCRNLPIPSLVIGGCMDDGITNDPWIIDNRPNNWVGTASNYNPLANVDDCDCIYQGTSSWDCDGQGNCFDPGTGLGQYPTLAICQQNCPVPCPSDPLTQALNITPATGGVGGCPNSLNDGSFGILLTAVQAPLASSTFTWAVQVEDSSGTIVHTSGPHTGLTGTPIFSGLSPDIYTYRITDLTTNCDWTYQVPIVCQDPPPPASFDCNPSTGGCFDPGTGNGQYSTLAACQAAAGCEPQGCTDPCACNYDPNATIDDGSCTYDCPNLPIMDTSWVDYLDANSALCQNDPNCNGVSSYTPLGMNAQNVANGCHFPNNEFAIQSFIANPSFGVHADMRQVKWYKHSGCNSYYHSLKIRQEDLDNWYQFGPGYYFFTWADYIDAAIATGIVPALDLLDPSQAGQINRDTSGYLIKFTAVNSVINQAFTAHCNANPGGQACNNSSGTITRCIAIHGNPTHCDRTYSTVCSPCATSTAIQPCGPPPPPPTPGNYLCHATACTPTTLPVTHIDVYASLALCLAACGRAPLESFDCDMITGTCYDPGNGLGQYTTMSDCISNCQPPPPPTNYICEQTNPPCNPTLQPVGGNIYATLADCQNNCGGGVSTNDIAWSGCCHPLAAEYNNLGYNGLPCHADPLCTCFGVNAQGVPIPDPLYCTLPNCFVAGTKVTMLDDSYKNIEDITSGDIVKSWNKNTGIISDNKVIALKQQTNNKTVKLSFGDIELTNTFDHPYYVENKGWCSYNPELTVTQHNIGEIKKLEIGDTCYKYNNGLLEKVVLTDTIENLEEVKTYIFTVEDDNTFFANNILVHNKQ